MSFSTVASFGCALALVLASVQAHARECAGVTLPDSVNVDGKRLVQNGMGLREATVFNVDVYVAAFYVEHRSTDAEALIGSEQNKLLELRFVRDVSREEMLEAMEHAMKIAAGDKYAAVKPGMDRLQAWLEPLTKGSSLTITYRPNVGIQVQQGARHLSVAGKLIADGVFRIWLGEHPPTLDLRRGLLGGPCG